MRKPSLPTLISEVIAKQAPNRVWTASDFAELGLRGTVDKALQRLARSGELRRIERGLYDQPRTNSLTQKSTAPDYKEILDAITRRDRVRMLVDGMTAANDLGLTNAVSAHVVVHTDARRSDLRLGNLVIEFKHTAPSRLYWAGRPAMRVVQALQWAKDTLPTDGPRIEAILKKILSDSTTGPAIRSDLKAGLGTLPAWMQEPVRKLIDSPP
jgi:hypothetical protein